MPRTALLSWLLLSAAGAWSTPPRRRAGVARRDSPPSDAITPDAQDVRHRSSVERRRGLLTAMLAAPDPGDEDIGRGGGTATLSDDDGGSDASMQTKIPSHLVNTLDIAPLLSHVASYACTKRGRDAITDLAATPLDTSFLLDKSSGGRKPSLFGSDRQQRRRDWHGGNAQGQRGGWSSLPPPISIAQSAEEAAVEYELVREAMVILQSQSSKSTIPLPPMFQLHEGVSTSVDSDDDEWVDMLLGPLPPGVDVYQEIDLEAILKAEQVLKLLLETYDWATGNGMEENAPGLGGIVRRMEWRDEEDGIDCNNEGRGDIQLLSDLYQTLNGAVEIVRAGPSMSDVHNCFSYLFQLSTGTGRYPELDVLREKEKRLLERKDDVTQQLNIIRNELSITEERITRTIIASMTKAAPHVQNALAALAQLDAVFARASFGRDWDGRIPQIGTEGRICVEKFVHPVLALEGDVVNGDEDRKVGVVPVDLILPGKGGYQSLMISGPNGGGKTLALKSFGLVAMMAKLGLPITTSASAPTVVDFFDDVHVKVGDEQSITKHESTLMARLNALSSLIENITAAAASPDSSEEAALVLLDELGGGTDPVAGSALAQSILEKIVSLSPMCKLVATTHSPQLKVLSIGDDRFECASVLMGNEKNPTFQLSYGTTGDSFALDAARRCRPSLPEDVIDRAAQLMNAGDNDAVDILKHYLTSLEEEKQRVSDLASETQATWKEIGKCRDDMLSKIEVSKTQLSRLESRLDSIFETLKTDDTKSSYELVGDSLDELRLLKRKVQTEEELLSEKGLRRVGDSHSFYEGEMVVIIAEGEWKGYDAVVKATDDPLTVTVVRLDWFAIDEDDAQEPLVLSRRDVAVFDYPDPEWGFDDSSYGDTGQEQQYSSERPTK
ncbi:hypothetical protein ACHAXT_002855 [Thalassiosira profunda]